MTLVTVVALAIAAELLEATWQYAHTLGAVLDRLYRVWRRSRFLFFALHTGYLYILYVSLRFDLLNIPIIAAIALKTLDIFTKLELIRHRYLRSDPDPRLAPLLDTPVPLWLYLIGPLTYPWLIYLALTWR